MITIQLKLNYRFSAQAFPFQSHTLCNSGSRNCGIINNLLRIKISRSNFLNDFLFIFTSERKFSGRWASSALLYRSHRWEVSISNQHIPTVFGWKWSSAVISKGGWEMNGCHATLNFRGHEYISHVPRIRIKHAAITRLPVHKKSSGVSG